MSQNPPGHISVCSSAVHLFLAPSFAPVRGCTFFQLVLVAGDHLPLAPRWADEVLLVEREAWISFCSHISNAVLGRMWLLWRRGLRAALLLLLAALHRLSPQLAVGAPFTTHELGRTDTASRHAGLLSESTVLLEGLPFPAWRAGGSACRLAARFVRKLLAAHTPRRPPRHRHCHRSSNRFRERPSRLVSPHPARPCSLASLLFGRLPRVCPLYPVWRTALPSTP